MGKTIDIKEERRKQREIIHAEMAERTEAISADRSGYLLRIAGYAAGVDHLWPGTPMNVDEWMRYVAAMDKGPRKAVSISIRWEDLEAIVAQAYKNGKKAACLES